MNYDILLLVSSKIIGWWKKWWEAESSDNKCVQHPCRYVLHRHTKLSSSGSATMGNTQNSLDAGEEDVGWCAAKREVKEHGQKPKLNFQRRHRKGEKNVEDNGLLQTILHL